MITPENILSHELVGLDAQIVSSVNRDLVGLNGTITDETKSMLKLYTTRGPKSAPKEGSRWRLVTEGGDALVDGSLISKRPYDRIGAKWPRT
ncbi:MAG: ribonuclease P protein subunit [Nitrosopumilus sp. H8]|nr:MAG: ribonuclease P protein subunit [Nitrosopumilus sp. H13]RNJ78718.1 MAG: ribonuclease P protein subunit [Nitrosopumilus sp. H8]